MAVRSIDTIGIRMESALENRALFYGILLLTALLTYGMEVFAFHLGIDEELHATFYSHAGSLWISQGRWGMALVNAALLPHPILPVVSEFTGLAGTALGLNLALAPFIRSRLACLCAVAAGLTFPTLAFVIVFKTLAYGIGVGFVSAVGCQRGAASRHLLARIGAVLCGALAIGIYQPFVFVIALFAASSLWAEALAVEGRPLRLALRHALTIVAAFAVYFAVDYAVRRMLRIDLVYVQNRLDFKGLFVHPGERLGNAATNTGDVLGVGPTLFAGRCRPVLWLQLLCGAGMIVSVARARRWTARLWLVLIALGMAAVPILADAIPPALTTVWTMVYIPVLVALIVGFGLDAMPRGLKVAAAGLTVFAVIGDAGVANRLFLSSQMAYARDVAMAQQVDARVGAAGAAPLKLVLSGYSHWAEAPLIPERETFGASFFAWDHGNPNRVASFLRLVTSLPVTAGDPAVIRDHAAEADAMPDWPAAGSVKVEDGVMILKLSPFSTPQRELMCSAGQKTYCGPAAEDVR